MNRIKANTESSGKPRGSNVSPPTQEEVDKQEANHPRLNDGYEAAQDDDDDKMRYSAHTKRKRTVARGRDGEREGGSCIPFQNKKTRKASQLFLNSS